MGMCVSSVCLKAEEVLRAALLVIRCRAYSEFVYVWPRGCRFSSLAKYTRLPPGEQRISTLGKFLGDANHEQPWTSI
jgi:hypothetical protein